MKRVVTIDGPAGAGKSTVARRLADRLGWRFLDTGAMYRAVTLAASAPGSTCRATGPRRSGGQAEVSLPPGRVLLGDEDVTAEIRSRRRDAGIEVRGRQPGRPRTARVLATRLRRDRRHGRPRVATRARSSSRTRSASSSSPPPTRSAPAAGSPITGPGARRSASRTSSPTSAPATPATRLRAIAPMKPAGDATVVDTTGHEPRGGRRPPVRACPGRPLKSSREPSGPGGPVPAATDCCRRPLRGRCTRGQPPAAGA